MNDLYNRLGTWGQGSIDGQEAIRIVKRIWDIGEEEGYTSERGRLAADAVLVAAAHSEYVPRTSGVVIRVIENVTYPRTAQKQPWSGPNWDSNGHPMSWARTVILPKRCE